MESKGFEGNLSEKSKEALQSETWQKVRDGMKEKKIEHFTATAGNAYGWTWDQVVKEYLRSGYNAADSSPDIVVMGETYKTLKRPEVTVFYDAAGDTLFDVTNERLDKEYEWQMNSNALDAAENREEKEVDGKGDSVVEQEEEDPEAGEAPSEERAETDEQGSTSDLTGNDAEGDSEPQSPETAESKEVNAQDNKSIKQQAEEKLKREMEAAKDKSFAEPIINYLLKRCNEDEGMAEDVVQEHKTWKKCFNYIYSRAREQAKGNCAAVRDDVVYEWAEDYYHKDDKAEEEKKAQKAAKDKAKKAASDSTKKAKSAEERKAVRAKNTADKAEKAPAPSKAEAPKEPSKPKRNGKEMDGQLDMFAMMGM